jgi:hypothetical protein
MPPLKMMLETSLRIVETSRKPAYFSLKSSEIKLPRYQDTGRLIGYGHVTFDTPEAREAV